MKNKLTLVITFCFYILNLFGQDSKSSASWFNVKVIAPKVWAISDHGAVNMYLEEGSDSALLIDTGMGVANLLSQIRELTAKPLIVVNTHGHSDHAGGDYQFDRIYVNAADSAASRSSATPESRVTAAKNMLRGAIPQSDELYKGKEINPVFVSIGNGYIFNLGGRKLKVITTPGHTPGSICLLDKENKLLFSGDNDNTAVWLFLPESLPLSVYLKSLQTLNGQISDFDTILPGHGIPKKSDFILDQIECVKSILNRTCKSEDYETFAGKAKLCQYKAASVAYNPENF